jgi:heterodisulfide reductase subunit C
LGLPSIIPFKPTEGAILEHFKNPNPEEIIYVTIEAVKLLKEERLSPIKGPGCIGCGACTLESDVYKIK